MLPKRKEQEYISEFFFNKIKILIVFIFNFDKTSVSLWMTIFLTIFQNYTFSSPKLFFKNFRANFNRPNKVNNKMTEKLRYQRVSGIFPV